MSTKIYSFILFSLLVVVFLSALVVAEELKLPPSLQKIEEYNQQQADYYLKNISFVVAFIAGMLSLLSPCTLALLPGFFAYTFKEKKQITRMTTVFFVGFTIVFIILGLIATSVGLGLASFQLENSYLTVIAGILLIMLGVMTILGKGFTLFKVPMKVGHRPMEIFLMGVLYAVGWTVCIGPILSGILLIAAALTNYVFAAVLMFFYALGTFVPLFILSFFYDQFNLADNKFIQGKIFDVTLFNKNYKIHSTSLIAGVLLIIVGLLFVIYKGTSVINANDFLAKGALITDRLQRSLFNVKFVNILGVLVLAVFLFFLYKFLKKKK